MRTRLLAVVLTATLAAPTAQAFTVLCLGDSNTDLLVGAQPKWSELVAAQHRDWLVINKARAGSTAVFHSPGYFSAKPTLDRKLGEHPDVDAVVLAFGTTTSGTGLRLAS
jgi:hypothetical protein